MNLNLHWSVKKLWTPTIQGTTDSGQKNVKLMWRCHQLLSGFLDNGNLSRVSRQSCLSANNREITRLNRWLCTDLLEFTLRLAKTPVTSAREPSRWRLCDQSPPQMRSLTSKWSRWDRTARQKDRRKGRNGWAEKLKLLKIIRVWKIKDLPSNEVSLWCLHRAVRVINF